MRGLGSDDDANQADPLARDNPLLARPYAHPYRAACPTGSTRDNPPSALAAELRPRQPRRRRRPLVPP
jgi:hypothetical protein